MIKKQEKSLPNFSKNGSKNFKIAENDVKYIESRKMLLKYHLKQLETVQKL